MKDVIGVLLVMVVRGVVWNVFVFWLEGMLYWEDVKIEYVKRCIEWDNNVYWMKYILKVMIMYFFNVEFFEGKVLICCKILVVVVDVYGL